MSSVDGTRVAAVVQDALTGQILWVGHLAADAPKQMAETGNLTAHGIANGARLSVRHLSPCGAGLIIHVEGPSTRHQLDSLLPDMEEHLPLPGRGTTAPTPSGSGSWPRAEASRVLAPKLDIESEIKVLTRLLETESTDAIAEQGLRALFSLLDVLRAAGVPHNSILEAIASE